MGAVCAESPPKSGILLMASAGGISECSVGQSSALFLILHPVLFRLGCVNEASVPWMHYSLGISVGPVSYTHLDVYKRQVLHMTQIQ